MILQKTKTIPNIAYTPSIKFQQNIVNGKLITNLKIVFCAAKVTDAGTKDEIWESVGLPEAAQISDISNPESELLAQKSSITTRYTNLMNIVDEINQIKKVM